MSSLDLRNLFTRVFFIKANIKIMFKIASPFKLLVREVRMYAKQYRLLSLPFVASKN